MKAILEVTGCCNQYRAELTIRPNRSAVIHVTALGLTAKAAHAALIALVQQMKLPDLDVTAIKPRRWPTK